LLLALFIAGTITQSLTFPIGEGSDEPLHFAYVAYLREHRTLPDRTNYLENCTRQQGGQPPLMYGLAAGLLDAVRVPNPGCDATFSYFFEQTDNPWALTPNPTRRDDNNMNFLPLATVPPPEGLRTGMHVARLVSVMFGAVGVVGAYLAAGEVFRRRVWPLTAAAVFAFTPTHFHIAAYFTNDSAAIAFTTLVVWRSLHLLNRGITVPRLLVIGMLVGLGALAKVSVLLVAPSVALAVAFVAYRNNPSPVYPLRNGAETLPENHVRHISLPSWRGKGRGWGSVWRIVISGLIITVPIALTAGVWALWGLIAYGDPTGTGTHVHPTLRYDPPLAWDATLRTMPDVFATYMALLGYATVYMGRVTYGALSAVMGVAAVGLLLGVRRQDESSTRPYPVALILGALWIAVFGGFLVWYRTVFDSTGRLILPAHISLAVAVTAGLATIATRFPRLGSVLRAVTVGVFMLTGGVFTFVSLHAAYAPALMDRANLPALQGPMFDFDDTVRLLGYAHDGDTFTDTDQITLCWEVLQPTDRLAAYAVRYVRDGVQAANRTTIHGLGKYNSTLWRPGDLFCDAVDMPVGDS
ncbi:MAG: glycosyltransferase family 39 protein, partial [Chloroflexota bacterium]